MTAEDLPSNINFAIMYRMRINSFGELPEEKRPPRDLWDKPSKLKEFLDEVFESKTNNNSKKKDFIPYNTEEVE